VASRRRTAQRRPSAKEDYSAFPSKRLTRRRTWFRNHTDRPVSVDRGAWWFASLPASPAGMETGRFDLPAPDGTCYLADTKEGAVRERVGWQHAHNGWISGPSLVDRVVSKMRLPRPLTVADVSSAEALHYRVTGELADMEDYDITQEWAQVLRKHAFEGVSYKLRFTSSAQGLAMFGAAGAPPDPAIEGIPEPLRPIVERWGWKVVDPPAKSTVTIIGPPVK
jgi:hypothetical protein